jgi:hypothetical protein
MAGEIRKFDSIKNMAVFKDFHPSEMMATMLLSLKRSISCTVATTRGKPPSHEFSERWRLALFQKNMLPQNFN